MQPAPVPIVLLLIALTGLQGLHAQSAIATVSQVETESEWEGFDTALGIGLLQAGRDLFQARAAFDFSAGFYSPRGMDRRESTVLFNGIPMNSALDGRPLWSVWSGLTDITRRAEQYMGRSFSPQVFAGALGAQYVEGRPSAIRPGTRLTLSATNRSYRWRQMATYNSGMQPSGLGYLISVSHRSGNSGYRLGSPYNSLAGYAAMEWVLFPGHSLLLAGVLSHTLRAQQAALTDEISGLLGPRYSPYWGWDAGEVRNSRQRLISEPLLTATYSGQGGHWRWHLASGLQWGAQTRTRLGYYKASNPDPMYYRNLPSYYYNSPFGVNFSNAQRAAEALVRQPQVDWNSLYQANRTGYTDGRASYLLTGDERTVFSWSTNGTLAFEKKGLRVNGGLYVNSAKFGFHQRILDLLGAEYHWDADPFTDTRNDLEGPGQKGAGDWIGYAYDLNTRQWKAFLQAWYSKERWEGGLSLTYGGRKVSRTRLFQNARYPLADQASGPEIAHDAVGAKAGLGYRMGGHAWLYSYLGYEQRPPLAQDVFVDPREHNGVFPLREGIRVQDASLDLHLRYPKLKGRASVYFADLTGGRALRSYFSETAYGAAFFREVTGGISSRHRGVELGLEYEATPAVTLTWASAFGSATYVENPELWMYASPDAELSVSEPEWGEVALRNLHLPVGPEVAAAFGIGYRSSRFWWLDARTVYMGNAYIAPALVRYTNSFSGAGADTGTVSNISSEDLSQIRKQIPLPPVYLLNLSLGKSWLSGNHYISAFLGINNLFDQAFVTGGYQQGRKGTLEGVLQDNQSGHPSFGPRMWQGLGRTFYLNIAWSF